MITHPTPGDQVKVAPLVMGVSMCGISALNRVLNLLGAALPSKALAANFGAVVVHDVFRTGVQPLRKLDGRAVVMYNAAFDLARLEHHSIFPDAVHCTLQACRLLVGEGRADLRAGAFAFLDLDLDKAKQTSDWSAEMLTPAQIKYAARDAVVTWQIAEKVLPRFNVQRSAYEIQMQAVLAAMRMGQRGFRLDVAAHPLLVDKLRQEREQVSAEYADACRECGHPDLAEEPPPSTPAQKEALLTILLSSDELAHRRRTEKTGALSTRRSELLRAAHYPPIRALVKLSRIDKLLSSFGPTLTELVSTITVRIHADY
jgi:DNA polymerase I